MRSSTCWFQRAFPELVRCESNLSPGRLTVSTLGVRVFVCGYIPLSPASCLSGVIKRPTPGSATTFPSSATIVPHSIVVTSPLHTASGEGSPPGFGYYILVLKDVFFRHVDKHKVRIRSKADRYTTSGRSGGEQVRSAAPEEQRLGQRW